MDGTHGESLYPYTILALTTLDVDNATLVLAFAFVPTEDQNNWEWFLGGIRPHLPSLSESEMIVISDRDKELINAIKNVLPDATHVHYCQHIAENIKV